MSLTPLLRVLVLAPLETDLNVLFGSLTMPMQFSASSPANWCASGTPGDFGNLLDQMLAGAEEDARDVLRVQLASGQRAMLACTVDPVAAPLTLLVRLAAHADLAILPARLGRPLDAGRRRGAELALLAGVAHLVVDGISAGPGLGAPFPDDAWVASSLQLRHDPALQKVTCLVPSSESPGSTAVELQGIIAAARTRQEQRRSAALRLVVTGAASDNSPLVRVASGEARAGVELRAVPGGQSATLQAIRGNGSALDLGVPGQTVGLVLSPALPALPPGTVLADAGGAPQAADGFEAGCLWLDPEPLLPGRTYVLRFGDHQCEATVVRLKYRVDPGTPLRVAATLLQQGEVGVGVLELDHAIAFDPFLDCADTGGGLLVQPESGRPLGVVFLHFALRRAQNVHWQAVEVNKQAHARLKQQHPVIVWLTGLSGAGKSTIANLLQQQLHALGHHTYLLDGDNVRHGLNKDLGFTAADRVENIRRVGEVAKLMVDAGLIVITAFISPFRDERRMVRNLVEAGEFIEVFVDTPLAVAEARDPKGLYRKARSGRLSNFTGIDSPYEPPEHPEIRIDTTQTSAADGAANLLAYLQARGLVREDG